MSGLPPDHESYARAALVAYGRDRDTPMRLLSLSENATYLADDRDPIVLRVHRPGYHSLDGIRSELKWMAALREQTPVVTPELIPARDGSEVVAATVAGNTLHVDAVTFISGCTAEEQPDVSVSTSWAGSPRRCTTTSRVGPRRSTSPGSAGMSRPRSAARRAGATGATRQA